MRMRFKPYARPELAAWACYVDGPKDNCGRWGQAFADPKLPLRLELGCGKGGFLAQRGIADPGFNYLGIDIKSEMLVVAKRNIERVYRENGRTIDNILITSWDIERLQSLLSAQDTVDRIYINFCNPWYKSGHAKHRLTHPRQLAIYRSFLAPGAEIWFKTDDSLLFSDSLRYFKYTGFEVTWRADDLHADEPDWNVQTEHEQMFANEGKPIHACIAAMRPAQLDFEAISRLKNI